MRRSPESFAAAVRAFKDLTAATDDAAATRARVLAAADRGSRAHATPRRIALATVVALLVICTASLAGTTLARRWRRPAEVAIEAPQAIAATASTAMGRASVVIPPAPPADVDGDAALPSGPSDAEAAAYGRAHRAHFDGGRPERALGAWDDYLRLYPRGAFVPEAHYNRALCLARLRRFEEAERALLPFADGHLGGYRRAEANQMLDWLRERRSTP
jgi:tetratricopeptide (TPR) repeat protein